MFTEHWVCTKGYFPRYTLQKDGPHAPQLPQSLIMQDNISKINDRLEDARSGCDKIDDTLKRKQLSVNYDKSKYLLIGSQKFSNEMLNTLKVNPLHMGGVVIDHYEKEK